VTPWRRAATSLFRLVPLVVLLGAVLFAAPLAAQSRRPISEYDLLSFKWVADPRISPDGATVAYVLVTVNEAEDRYDTSVWVVPSAGGVEPRRVTLGPRDTSPRWSPDSKTLAFLRSAGEKERPQIWLLPMSGGDPRGLTDLPKGASNPVWSPDGKTIAFGSGTTDEDLAEQRDAKAHPDAKAKKKSDVRVVTRAVFRTNGQGWLDPAHRSHVWTVAVASSSDGSSPAPRRVTSGRYDEGEIEWSADGTRLYFTSDRVDEPYYEPGDSNLYAVSAAASSDGPLETVIDIAGPVRSARLSPDGNSWAFVGSINPKDVQSHTRSDVFVLRGGKP
jgi:dipeptidyl aminopeptidase/acylaminoacyl peptidase